MAGGGRGSENTEGGTPLAPEDILPDGQCSPSAARLFPVRPQEGVLIRQLSISCFEPSCLLEKLSSGIQSLSPCHAMSGGKT